MTAPKGQLGEYFRSGGQEGKQGGLLPEGLPYTGIAPTAKFSIGGLKPNLKESKCECHKCLGQWALQQHRNGQHEPLCQEHCLQKALKNTVKGVGVN